MFLFVISIVDDGDVRGDVHIEVDIDDVGSKPA